MAQGQLAQGHTRRVSRKGREAAGGDAANVRKSQGFQRGEGKKSSVVEAVGREVTQVEVLEFWEVAESRCEEAFRR